MSAHFLQACAEDPAARWALQEAASGRTIATTLWPAFDRTARNRGLLGRDHLAAGEALVLAPCAGVHTWFMRFAIDILFVGRDGTVLKVRRAVPPWRLAVRVGAFAVVELAADAAAGVAAGQRLVAVRRTVECSASGESQV